MAEDSFNPRAELGKSHGGPRTVPRYSVLAVAELVETASTMCIVGKLTEVSRKGCYVNTPSTLPVNTFLRENGRLKKIVAQQARLRLRQNLANAHVVTVSCGRRVINLHGGSRRRESRYHLHPVGVAGGGKILVDDGLVRARSPRNGVVPVITHPDDQGVTHSGDE